MKSTKTIYLILLIIFIYRGSIAQVTTPANTGINTNYVGWRSTQLFPLMVRHNGPYAIDFYTDSLFRVTIDSVNGFIGAGLRLPQNQIHQHNPSGTGNTYHQFTNGNTNSNANNGFRIGLTYNAASGLSIAELMQFQNSHMDFFTSNVRRMRIDSLGNTLINTTNSNLAAQLEVRASAPVITNMGWNAAIKVSNTAAICFDNDDPNDSTGNRFYFIGGPTLTPMGDFLHSLYPSPDGNDTPQYVYRLYGRTRVGNPTQGEHEFLTNVLMDSLVGVNTLFPSKRVEIVDADTTQLRLTDLQRTTVGGSRATDFQTTNNGNLYINPHDSITQGSVGINKFIPISTLHVGGTFGTSGAITSDFLNHSTSPSLPSTNPWIVYSDTNGTLKHLPRSTDPAFVLHGDGSWGSGGSGTVNTGCGGTTINFVPKFSTSAITICNSQIYDDPTYGVGIGTGALGIPTTAPLQKLTVDGNFDLTDENYGYYLNHRRFLASEGNGYEWSIYLGLDAGPPAANANTGYGNYCIGNNSGAQLSGSGGGNILIGSSAGNQINANAGAGNVCVGENSGLYLQDVGLNTFVGTASGAGFALRNGNVVVGANAGTNGDGTDNVIMGHDAQSDWATEIDSSVALGVSAWVTGDRSVALGQQSRAQDNDVIVMGNSKTRTLMGYTTAPTVASGAVDSAARLNVAPVTGTRAAFFNGSIATTHMHIVASDRNLKTNIQNMPDVTSIIDQLLPKTYYFDQQNHPGLNLPIGFQYGLISQDVEALLPNLVETEYVPATLDTGGNILTPSSTFKGLNYTGLIPILIKGLQEQKSRLDALEAQLEICCNSSHVRLSSNVISVELSNSIVLNQNDPNPFEEETIITFNIPGIVSEAKIIFTDNESRIIQTVKINERGSGQLHVYASTLHSGIYTYTLIADGKVIDSKRMVCTK